eukprot:scaffold27084_cov28-Prasinocladus_malaysianus.AAC.1
MTNGKHKSATDYNIAQLHYKAPEDQVRNGAFRIFRHAEKAWWIPKDRLSYAYNLYSTDAAFQIHTNI